MSNNINAFYRDLPEIAEQQHDYTHPYRNLLFSLKGCLFAGIATCVRFMDIILDTFYESKLDMLSDVALQCKWKASIGVN